MRIQEIDTIVSRKKGVMEENLMFRESVGPENIAQVVSCWTGIPVTRLSQNQKTKLNGLAYILHERVFRQDEVVQEVVEVVLISWVRTGTTQQQTVYFLLLWPTRVGKIELTNALAAQFLDDENQIFHIDISEYMEQHLAARLIGSPLGYVAGKLIEEVRRTPNSVFIFDEDGKEHTSVINTLLQMFLKNLKNKTKQDGQTSILQRCFMQQAFFLFS